MMSFINWVRCHTIITRNQNESDVLDKISADTNFPKTVRKWIVLDYLNLQKYNKSEINIIDDYFHQYIKYINHAVDPDK